MKTILSRYSKQSNYRPASSQAMKISWGWIKIFKDFQCGWHFKCVRKTTEHIKLKSIDWGHLHFQISKRCKSLQRQAAYPRWAWRKFFFCNLRSEILSKMRKEVKRPLRHRWPHSFYWFPQNCIIGSRSLLEVCYRAIRWEGSRFLPLLKMSTWKRTEGKIFKSRYCWEVVCGNEGRVVNDEAMLKNFKYFLWTWSWQLK